jgi:hypothetical protein
VRLESGWLKDKLDLTVAPADVERYRHMDDPGIIQSIYQIAKIAAERQVRIEHLVGKTEVARGI